MGCCQKAIDIVRHLGTLTAAVSRACLVAALFFCLAGCAPTHVRVLNEVTGQPVAGATLTPWCYDLFGDPCRMERLATSEDGRATIPYRRSMAGVDVSHPSLRQVHPADKPPADGNEILLYMRPPQRVVVPVPHDFVGPVLISDGSFGDEKEPIYRLAMANDVLKPIEAPGWVSGVVRPEEFEAERDGVSIPAASGGISPLTAGVFSCDCGGAFYEEDYVEILFIGSSAEFAVFAKGLHEYLHQQKGAAHIDRSTLIKLRSVAAAAGENK
jgi:hypothetical protein